jgi:FlaA1/EpsC-like NDP-sugar epimerase
LDDDLKKGLRIEGVPVMSPVDEIHKFAYEVEMNEISIAMPPASAKQMQRIEKGMD